MLNFIYGELFLTVTAGANHGTVSQFWQRSLPGGRVVWEGVGWMIGDSARIPDSVSTSVLCQPYLFGLDDHLRGEIYLNGLDLYMLPGRLISLCFTLVIGTNSIDAAVFLDG